MVPDSSVDQRCEFFDLLRNAGVAKVEADYSGSDDEGWITDCSVFAADGRKVAEGSEQFDRSSGTVGWTELLDPIFAFLNAELSGHSPNWEDNEGSAGSVTIDVAAGTAEFDHGVYLEPQLEPQPFRVKVGGNVDTDDPRDRIIRVLVMMRPESPVDLIALIGIQLGSDAQQCFERILNGTS